MAGSQALQGVLLTAKQFVKMLWVKTPREVNTIEGQEVVHFACLASFLNIAITKLCARNILRCIHM
jgi:hypothetical protein